MTNTSPTSDEELRDLRMAITRDFAKLYVKKFTTNWEAQRVVRALEIELMEFSETLELIRQDRQAYLQSLLPEDKPVSLIDLSEDEINGYSDDDLKVVITLRQGFNAALADIRRKGGL